MAIAEDSMLHEQLLDRRHKLEDAISATGENEELLQLLQEVDAALKRIDNGIYGLCKTCKDPIERERLIADPLAQFCIDHLSPLQQRRLEEDLKLASLVQNGLLPKRNFRFDGWSVSYHYEAAGLVSGDYCDLINVTDSEIYFILGDVSGKGVAASMLMAQLHATFRTLISVGMQLDQMVERASRIFCETTLPMHFATLVCGKASITGEVEICNAGHLPPFILHKGEVVKIDATGLPVGIFCNEHFSIEKIQLSAGDTLLLYTDGLTEAQNASGIEYGSERLTKLASSYSSQSPQEMIEACLKDMNSFRAGVPKTDDLTLMALRRES
jgi:phosphoserine phosphatase RsbU/P